MRTRHAPRKRPITGRASGQVRGLIGAVVILDAPEFARVGEVLRAHRRARSDERRATLEAELEALTGTPDTAAVTVAWHAITGARP